MSKYTPGPWYLTPDDRTKVQSANDDAGGLLIAECEPGPYSPSGEECIANARLIAAAPEMLQALKSVAARNALPNSIADWIKLREIVFAAIAKAEGKE